MNNAKGAFVKWNRAQKMTMEDSDQPEHLPSLIRDFTVCLKKVWDYLATHKAHCEDWSGWINAQANLSLCWVSQVILLFRGAQTQNLFELSICICYFITWAPSSEFVSSSILSCQILTAHAQPFRGARDLAFCLKVPLDSLLVWASSEGSGKTAWMHRLAWTFVARIDYKYQIRLTRSIWGLFWECNNVMH